MTGWLLLLWACGADPCLLMCEDAAVRYEGCLEVEGLGWEAVGYEDAAGFEDSCLTWAWERRLLARDAGAPVSEVDETCEAWREVVVTGDCEELAALEW